MSPARLFLLVLLMLALAAALHFLGGSGGAAPEVPVPKPADRPLLPGRPEEVVRLTMHHTAREALIRLERQAGDWRLSEPIADRPEPEAVRVALEVLAGGDWAPAPPSWRERPAADLGLDPARIVVQVDHRDGTRHELRLGAPAAAGEWYAAERDGERIRLGARSFRVLRRPLQEWRDHRVLARPGSIHRLEYRPAGGGEGWVLDRSGGRWRLVEPMAVPLSPLARSAVARLLGARIEDLRDDAITAAERSRLAAGATLVAEGGGQRQVLHLDGAQGWLEGRPYLLALDAGDFRLLDMDLETLRSHRLLDLEPTEVVSLRLERGDRVLELRRRGPAWAVLGGPVLDPGDAETAAWHRYITDLVERLCRLELREPHPCPGGEEEIAGSILLSRSPRPVERGGERLWWWLGPDGSSEVAAALAGPCSQVRGFNLDQGVRGLLEGLEELAGGGG